MKPACKNFIQEHEHACGFHMTYKKQIMYI